MIPCIRGLRKKLRKIHAARGDGGLKGYWEPLYPMKAPGSA